MTIFIPNNIWNKDMRSISDISHPVTPNLHIAHLRQQCHNSKFVIFQEKCLKVLKCYNCLWVRRQHNCSPAASFANSVMKLYLLKVHLQMFLSIPITQKCQKRHVLHILHYKHEYGLIPISMSLQHLAYKG